MRRTWLKKTKKKQEKREAESQTKRKTEKGKNIYKRVQKKRQKKRKRERKSPPHHQKTKPNKRPKKRESQTVLVLSLFTCCNCPSIAPINEYYSSIVTLCHLLMYHVFNFCTPMIVHLLLSHDDSVLTLLYKITSHYFYIFTHFWNRLHLFFLQDYCCLQEFFAPTPSPSPPLTWALTKPFNSIIYIFFKLQDSAERLHLLTAISTHPRHLPHLQDYTFTSFTLLPTSDPINLLRLRNLTSWYAPHLLPFQSLPSSSDPQPVSLCTPSSPSSRLLPSCHPNSSIYNFFRLQDSTRRLHLLTELSTYLQRPS